MYGAIDELAGIVDVEMTRTNIDLHKLRQQSDQLKAAAHQN